MERYRNSLSDNSQHFSVRPFCVTEDSAALPTIQFLSWVSMHLFHFRVLQFIWGFYSPYSKQVMRIFSFSSQLSVKSNKHVIHCTSKVLSVKRINGK